MMVTRAVVFFLHARTKRHRGVLLLESKKILIIEDEKSLARFLELELMHEGYSVEKAYNGNDGIDMLQNNSYDLLLLDIMLPGINGMEVLRRLRGFSSMPVIMLTARDSIIDKVVGLDHGADDYMTKPFAIEELLARIRAALRNAQTQQQKKEELTFKGLIMDIASHTVTLGGQHVELTKKEFDLLRCLMENQGIVLSREALLQKVWGYDFEGETNSVDVYIRYLRSKIDEACNDKYIHTVRGVGYVVR